MQSHALPWVEPGVVDMALQRLNRLTALKIVREMTPGLHPDGGGLYLQVSSGGAKSWLFRYEMNGRERQMGLGSLQDVSLQKAREQAGQCRLQRHAGNDPIEARNAHKARLQLEAARAITFKEAAERYIEAHSPGWKNAKHRKQWTASLAAHAYPVMASVSVQEIDTSLVLKVLEPIWSRLPETAGRVRGRIEAVLDAAKARGERKGENPARHKGHLDSILPRLAKVKRVRHHPALPYSEIHDFLSELKEQPGTAATALNFLLLTAARTGEVIGAKWEEIDLDAKLWIIPANRMKGNREHRVPLSVQAITLLQSHRKACKAMGNLEFVFPSAKAGRGLSNGAMLMLLERMKRGDITVHGFRSTFRDWAADLTAYPREIAEAALAHAIEDRTEAAYLRSDMIDRRRKLMSDWAIYCENAPAVPVNVVNITRRPPPIEAA
jgi:integrase